MSTPIVILVLLTFPYLALRLYGLLSGRRFDARGAGAAGLGIAFLFFALGHFAETAAMALMLPPWVPARTPLIYATGVLELAIAVGLFLPGTRRAAGWAAAAVLVAFFPANIYAAMNHVPMGGHAWGPAYLLVRAPLQAILIAWVWWFVVREPRPAPRIGAAFEVHP
jgi:uncharacterized membrane protein